MHPFAKNAMQKDVEVKYIKREESTEIYNEADNNMLTAWIEIEGHPNYQPDADVACVKTEKNELPQALGDQALLISSPDSWISRETVVKTEKNNGTADAIVDAHTEPDLLYTCNICKGTFNNKLTFKEHLNSVHAAENYISDYAKIHCVINDRFMTTAVTQDIQPSTSKNVRSDYNSLPSSYVSCDSQNLPRDSERLLAESNTRICDSKTVPKNSKRNRGDSTGKHQRFLGMSNACDDSASTKKRTKARTVKNTNRIDSSSSDLYKEESSFDDCNKESKQCGAPSKVIPQSVVPEDRHGWLEDSDDSGTEEASGYDIYDEVEYVDDADMEVLEGYDDTETYPGSVAVEVVPTVTVTPSSSEHDPIAIQAPLDAHATPVDDVMMHEDVWMDAEDGNGTVDDKDGNGTVDDKDVGRVEVKHYREVGLKRGRGKKRGGGTPASTMRRRVACGEPLLEVYAGEADVPPELQHLVRVRETNATELRERRERQMMREREREERQAIKEEDEDVFFEVDDGRDEALLSSEAACFDWSPMDTFTSTKEVFVPEQTGSVVPRHTMYEAFRAYWDDEILEKIVTETNRHASSISGETFRSQWYPTNVHEILVLFTFWMMIGIVKMPTIKSCFSLDPLLKHDIFRKMFTQNRYVNLCRVLHFCKYDAGPPNASKLYLLGPIVDHLNAKFQSNFIPSQNLRLDESLTLWKGLLVFKQYIASKVAKYGIKAFELCDAATGYLWSFIIYTGEGDVAEDSSRSILKSTSLVLKLMRPLFGKGYTLFMNNWFNSPILARFLKRNNTDCVGTLRSTRRGVPPLVQLAQLRKGEFLARHAGDVSVLAWQDKRRVNMISTYHGTEQSRVTKGRGTRTSTVHKPQVLLDYNKNMGGVDRKDQMLEPYLMESKRHKKWYMKIFKRLLNCSILNSRILIESTKQVKIDHLMSRRELVHSILEHHLSLVPKSRERHSNSLLSVRSDAPFRHWPVRIAAERDAKNRSVQVRCIACSRKNKKNSKSMYKCLACDVPLCPECFEDFHS